MVRSLSVLLISAVVLTSCGSMRDSRLNPLNWFGRSQSQPVQTDADVNPLIPKRRAVSLFRQDAESTYEGRLIYEVENLFIERRPGGAIVRATGLSVRQGPYDVRLVKLDEESDDSTLTYEFKMLQAGPTGGPAASRRVTTAIALTDQQLFGIRTIRVKSATNIQSSRR